MKVLVLNNTGEAVFTFKDDAPIILLDDKVQVGMPEDVVHYFIGHCNSGNSTLYENVQLPADFLPGRYQFDGTTWTLKEVPVAPAPAEPAPQV